MLLLKATIPHRTTMLTTTSSLGLTLAEALAEAGGHVYCLDLQPKPRAPFYEARDRVAAQFDGHLHYRQADVQEAAQLDSVISEIAAQHQRLDGLVAAAGIQYVKPALEYPPEEVPRVSSMRSPARMGSPAVC